MTFKKEKGFLAGALFSAAACVFQIIGLIRYLGRLANDWVGIALYIVTIAAFSVSAVGFFIQYRRRRRKEESK